MSPRVCSGDCERASSAPARSDASAGDNERAPRLAADEPLVKPVGPGALVARGLNGGADTAEVELPAIVGGVAELDTVEDCVESTRRAGTECLSLWSDDCAASGSNPKPPDVEES